MTDLQTLLANVLNWSVLQGNFNPSALLDTTQVIAG